MMRMLALVVCLVACSKASKNATPKGTKVIEWDASKSDREAYRTATFENRKSLDKDITVKVCADDVKLKLHVETATAKYTEAGTAMEIGSLTSLTATVEDGKGYELTNGKCEGPNYELTAPGATPGFTILDCHMKGTKPSNDCAPFFQIKGDGTLMN